jgi:hypothetical protein
MDSCETIDLNVMMLLQNVDFLSYALNINNANSRHWKLYLLEHRELQVAADKATYIIHHLDDPSPWLTEDTIMELKNRIRKAISV